MRVRSALSMVAAAGLIGIAMPAQADFLAFIEVSVQNLDDNGNPIGQASNQLFDMGVVTGDTFDWSWGNLNGTNTSPLTLSNGATIHGLSLSLIADPVVSSSFNVAAGPMNSVITINSAIVNHPGFPSDVGRASAFIGITDSLNSPLADQGQISFVGLHGGKAFRPIFNGSSVFQDLITGPGNVAVIPGTSTPFIEETSPTGVYLPLGGTATSIQSQFLFSLSRFDRASGTSTFEVIPAPGAMALLGLGGLVAARRRRAC